MTVIENVPAEFQPKNRTIWWAVPIGVFVDPDTWGKTFKEKLDSISLLEVSKAGYRFMQMLGGWHSVTENTADLSKWPENTPSYNRSLGEPVLLVTGNSDSAVVMAYFIREEARIEGPKERVLKIVLPRHRPFNTTCGKAFIEGMLQAIEKQSDVLQSTTTAFSQELTLGVSAVEFNVYNPTDVLGVRSLLLS